ncbi:MAG TPA: magnesium-translocating P-type ATPase [Candidatus Peribacteraceae bacterium]|nr:magnesium-translocating P-type ATPase [Candidatus Peribacteraceae bacterium]
MPSTPLSHTAARCEEYESFARAAEAGLYRSLQSSADGLKDAEASKRFAAVGPNVLVHKREKNIVIQFLLRFANPLVAVLLIIAAFSVFLGDIASAILVSIMAIVSVLISFTQEYKAGKEAQKLSDMVRTTASVRRNGAVKELQMKLVVPGDIVELKAGDMIPADMRILESKDLFVNQASFTGESYPVEKFPDSVLTTTCELNEMTNIAFMGSSVVSGSARGIVLTTGANTQFGEISKRLSEITEVSGFDRGISRLTWMMIQFMIALVLIIFAINWLFRANWVDALLFSLAVAVGLTPEMLPMVVALNLAKGAIGMSKKSVIVKKLNSMQNFGSMDVLCTDKTGTLTLDKIVLEKFCDVAGKQNESVLQYAYLNSFYQTGMKDLLDRTILDHEHTAMHGYKKIDEIPFDFSRRVMSVIVEIDRKNLLICKGAPEEIYKRCTHYELDGKIYDIDAAKLTFLKKEYDELSAQGFRVLGVAYKETPPTQSAYSKDDEGKLILKGYLAFLDPPKTTALETINALRKLGISVKVLTGDNALVTKKICTEVGLNVDNILTGDDLETMSDDALQQSVQTVTVFARLSPLQKERVIQALHATRHVVGYLGDGINDAPALKAADVGISVNNAVDIAKESADIILLKKSLIVLRDGVVEGRKTFSNILKYIRMGTSSNLGNMFSMTGASLFLPYLPMTPIQILLNNFLYDLSQLAIPTDEVDEEAIAKPHQWDMPSIRRFMIVFGSISSLFDFLTFWLLVSVFHATADIFHTAWFVESLTTQTLVIYVIRTRKIPFFQSRPSTLLFVSTILLTLIGLILPYSKLAAALQFVALGLPYVAMITGILIAYLLVTQVCKKYFIKKFGYQ